MFKIQNLILAQSEPFWSLLLVRISDLVLSVLIKPDFTAINYDVV